MNRLAIVLFLLLSGTALAATSPGHAEPGPATMTDNEVRRLRAIVSQEVDAAQQFATLRQVADRALGERPHPVDKIITEGRLRSDPDKQRTGHALQDMKKISALAWAWAVTGEKRYADKAQAYILAWARINESDGNPINETNLEGLIEGYGLLRNTFATADRKLVDNWLRGKAKMLWESHRVRKQNWQSHRLKIVGLVSLTTEDAKLWSVAEEGFKQQIANNFRADGESTDFEVRDAMHYHLYAIEPLLTLACAARHRDDHLFTYQAPNGASLVTAVDFMVPYAQAQKTHVEFVHSTVEFDRKRAANGEETYSPHRWEPKNAIGALSEAACLDRRYGDIAATVAEKRDSKYINWQMVINAAYDAA